MDGRLLKKWRLVRAACSDKRLTAAADLRALVAILDRMNGRMEAWPGYGRIANDCGIDRSTARRAVDRLVEYGYLEKGRGEARLTNFYRLGANPPIGESAHRGESEQGGVGESTQGGVGESAYGVWANPPTKPRQRTRPKESDAEEPRANGSAVRDLQHPPFDEIVKIYHDVLPELRTVKKLTKARKEKIEAQWRTELKTTERWREYFEAVKRSPFLMGKKEPTPPRNRRFEADFDFLIQEDTVVAVAEGKYHDPAPASWGRVLN